MTHGSEMPTAALPPRHLWESQGLIGNSPSTGVDWKNARLTLLVANWPPTGENLPENESDTEESYGLTILEHTVFECLDLATLGLQLHEPVVCLI